MTDKEEVGARGPVRVPVRLTDDMSTSELVALRKWAIELALGGKAASATAEQLVRAFALAMDLRQLVGDGTLLPEYALAFGFPASNTPTVDGGDDLAEKVERSPTLDLDGAAHGAAPKLLGRGDALPHDEGQALSRDGGVVGHTESSIGVSTAPMVAEGGRVGNDPSSEGLA